LSKKNVRLALSVFAACLLHAQTSQAALIDRGGGLIYDTVLNVTWMQDAQYAITSQYKADGRLSWADAVGFASNATYADSVRGVVWDDWRLPSTVDLPTSTGYDLTGQTSELAFMYYVNLGYSPSPLLPSAPAPSSNAYNPFTNLAFRGYWSGTESGTWSGEAWGFHMHFGYQSLNGKNDGSRVWLLRDGDVASVSVPEPGTLALFGLGILGARVARRRQKPAGTAVSLI
jgi:hypothetical protein